MQSGMSPVRFDGDPMVSTRRAILLPAIVSQQDLADPALGLATVKSLFLSMPWAAILVVLAMIAALKVA